MGKLNRLLKNRDLLLIRLYYLFFIGGGGFIFPFLNLFYLQQGLTGSEIGLLASIGSVTSLIAAPLLAKWVNQSRHSKRILQTLLASSAVTLLWLSQQERFLGFALLTALQALFYSSIGPLSDQLTLWITGSTRAGFGSVRVWGSLGWSILGALSGWLIERTGFLAGFLGSSLTLVQSAALLQALPFQEAFEGDRPKAKDPGIWSKPQNFLRNRGLVGLALLLVIVGLFNKGVNQFEVIFLSQLGAGESLIGLVSMLGSLVEIPGMFIADRFLLKSGPRGLMMRALLLYAVLRGLILLFPSIPAIFLERAVGGIAFSFYTVGLVRSISEQTTQNQTAGLLAFYTITLVGIVNILSAPLAGYLFDLLGAYWLYAFAMAGYVLGWIVLRLARS